MIGGWAVIDVDRGVVVDVDELTRGSAPLSCPISTPPAPGGPNLGMTHPGAL
jgi:hypothetical protein